MILLLLPFIAGAIWWDRLPTQIPRHWNIHGQVDAYSGRFWGVMGLPLLTVGMWLVLVVVPMWAEKQGREQLRSSAWRAIRLATTLLLCGLQFAILLTALGHHMDMLIVVYYALVLFFILLGNVIGTTRPNYLVGVRVPWTLNNEEVWKRTHRFAGRLWVVLGVLFFAAGASLHGSGYAAALLAFIGLTSSVPVIYAYVISRHQAQ